MAISRQVGIPTSEKSDSLNAKRKRRRKRKPIQLPDQMPPGGSLTEFTATGVSGMEVDLTSLPVSAQVHSPAEPVEGTRDPFPAVAQPDAIPPIPMDEPVSLTPPLQEAASAQPSAVPAEDEEPIPADVSDTDVEESAETAAPQTQSVDPTEGRDPAALDQQETARRPPALEKTEDTQVAEEAEDGEVDVETPGPAVAAEPPIEGVDPGSAATPAVAPATAAPTPDGEGTAADDLLPAPAGCGR